MRSAASTLLIAGVGAVALGACSKQQDKPPTRNDELSLEENLASGQVPANVEVETLPPDESSGTSSGELNAGDDNPDVNDVGNGERQ